MNLFVSSIAYTAVKADNDMKKKAQKLSLNKSAFFGQNKKPNKRLIYRFSVKFYYGLKRELIHHVIKIL